MSARHFAVTWDYRCPFARNFCEHVLVGLEAGAPWTVEFLPFSLNQVHVAEGEPDVWDAPPAEAGSLLAMQVGIAVRARFPEAFPLVHAALFAARHDHGLDIREADVLRSVVSASGLDADAVFAEVDSGVPLETFRKQHERAVADYSVFGVPTIVLGNQATFVRVMHRPRGDASVAVATVERVLDLIGGWPELNELKHTTIPR